jgi:hypothetical protein
VEQETPPIFLLNNLSLKKSKNFLTLKETKPTTVLYLRAGSSKKLRG